MEIPDPEKDCLLRRDPEKGSKENSNELKHELFGYALIVGSGIFFETMALLVRYVTAYNAVPAKNIVFLRGVVQSSLSLFTACFLIKREGAFNVPRNSWLLLVLRGALGGASLAFDFPMLSRVPLGPATSIFFLNPVFTLILSITILRERVNRREVFACVICFIGIVLVSNPRLTAPKNIEQSYLNGVMFGLCGAFLTALEIICVRVLAERIHFIVNVLVMGIGTVIAGVIVGGSSSIPVVDKPIDIAIAILACSFGFFGQCMLNAALKFCRASTGAILRNIDVPFGYCLGMLLGEVPRLVAMVGSGLVVVGTAIVGSNAAKKERR